MKKVYAIRRRSCVGNFSTEVYVSSLKKAFDYIETLGQIRIFHNISSNDWTYKQFLPSATWAQDFAAAKRHPDKIHFANGTGDWFEIKAIQVF